MFKVKTAHNQTRILTVVIISFLLCNIFIYSHSHKECKCEKESEQTDVLKLVQKKTNKDNELLSINKVNGKTPIKIKEVFTKQTLNEHRYKVSYLMKPRFSYNSICDNECEIKGGQNYTMVTFIKSKASNTKIRNFLRRTWTSIKYTRNGILLYVFVVGRPKSEETFNLIEEESNRYEDILMFDGPDDYKNIGRKTLAGMQWASENLPSSFYYSSGDDDFMIDVATLDDIMMMAINTTSQLPYFPFICVSGLVGPRVHRDPNSKYYVPESEYTGEQWPRGCLGGFYSTKVAVIEKVWGRSRNETMVRMDDVWVTGVLREKSGIPDSCVIEAHFKADLHTWGYRGRGDPGSKTFMEEERQELEREINKRPHCRCK